jgi:hypothetical protein
LETGPRGYALQQVETGPIRESVVADLEALKWRLAAMESPDELSAAQAEAIRTQISAIRLHLKRLDLDRRRTEAEIAAAVGVPVPPARG